MNFFVRKKLVVEDPDRLFFTADPHFFHGNIIKLAKRPFKDLEEMHKAIAWNWRKAVSDGDDIVILGDMFWKEDMLPEYVKLMEFLPGRKHLVRGNHDYFSDSQYLDMGFASVQDYLEVLPGAMRVACSHYPMLEWNGYWKGALHLFGHVHGNLAHPDRRALDAGVDANGFAPLAWKDVLERCGVNLPALKDGASTPSPKIGA